MKIGKLFPDNSLGRDFAIIFLFSGIKINRKNQSVEPAIGPVEKFLLMKKIKIFRI